jgi:hypothetical protein
MKLDITQNWGISWVGERANGFSRSNMLHRVGGLIDWLVGWLVALLV